MVDKVRPLKLEDTGTGSSLDMFPTELNPAQDFVASKGLALEGLDNTTIRGDAGVMKFKDSDVTTETTLRQLLDGGNGVSPGFSFGRSGTTTSGTYLQTIAGVPSNKSNIPVNITLPKIVRITAGTEDLDTYTLQIYEHEGNEINLTLLTSISSVAVRSADSGVISVTMTSGRRLAAFLSAGSGKNLTVQLIVKGTN